MYNGKKIVATIEARMTSTRLPGKVLLPLGEKSDLEHIIERIGRSKYVDEVVVATTVNATDDVLVQMCVEKGHRYYRGSEDDVLLRVLEAAQSVNAEIIVETTGDNPIVDWRIIDEMIEFFFSKDVDYAANMIERTYPMGLDIQVFPTSVLADVNARTDSPVDHEHVSLYIYTHPEIYKIANKEAPLPMQHPEFELTLDTPEDYQLLMAIYEKVYEKNKDFSAEEVVELLLTDELIGKQALAKTRKNAFKQQKEWLDSHEKEA